MVLNLILHGCLFKTPIQKVPLQHQELSDEVCRHSSRTRLKWDRGSLVRDQKLDLAAKRYADVLRDHHFFAHNDPRWWVPKTPMERVLAAGGEYRTTGENLAKIPVLQIPIHDNSVYILDREKHLYSQSPNGKSISFHTITSGAHTLVESWMNSPPHREVLLHHEMKYIGCGTAIQYRKGHIPMIISVQLLQTQ